MASGGGVVGGGGALKSDKLLKIALMQSFLFGHTLTSGCDLETKVRRRALGSQSGATFTPLPSPLPHGAARCGPAGVQLETEIGTLTSYPLAP